jgi:hypothetical protein
MYENAVEIDMANMFEVLYGTDPEKIIKASDRELKKLSNVNPVNAEHKLCLMRTKITLYLSQLPKSKADKAHELFSSYESYLIESGRTE